MYSLHLSAEQLAIRDTVRDFVAQKIKPIALRSERLEPRAKPLLLDALDQTSQLGLRTLMLSEDAGGARADLLTCCIVIEELAHFNQVLDLLHKRGVPFRKLSPSNYGRQLNDLVRKFEPDRAVDRLLVAGLIEARSCERFDLLRQHIEDRKLADFYGSLFESEARHHSTYVRLAKLFADDEKVQRRLTELAAEESRIIEAGDPLPRMHS